jgi:hypothetical protein
MLTHNASKKEKNVAQAAPIVPYIGINRKFKIILTSDAGANMQECIIVFF